MYSIGNVVIATKADLAGVDGRGLLQAFNALTGKSTAKFSSRTKGEQQVWKAIQAKAEPVTSMPAVIKKEPAAKKAAAPKAPKKAAAARQNGVFNYAPDAKVQKHREGTKRAKVIELLGSKEGATLEEVQKAVGWDAKTAYDGIRLLHTYLGYGLRTSDNGRIHLVNPK